MPIARSEPIHVDGTAIPPTTTTVPPTATCEVTGAVVCDDGDPCTVDDCVPGRGCVSAPATGYAAVTCTCRRPDPAVCEGEPIPVAIRARREQACGLLDDAGATTDRRRALKRLRRAVKMLRQAIAITSSGHRNGVSPDCASALRAELRDDRARVERFRTTLPR